jgi:hydrogenase maturation protease
MEKTLIIGLGNPILTDDGVGIYTARAIQTMLSAETDVDIIELSVGGLALMEAMIGYERVILIDALWSPPDEVGQVYLFDAKHLPETLNTCSTHDVDLPTALRLGRTIGASLPDDSQISIVAITVNRVLDFGESLTAKVKAAIPIARDSVQECIDKMS